MTDIQLQELGPCKRKLSVRIPPERVRDAMRQGWSNAQRAVNMKGFRPGKVPRSLIEKKHGEEIRKEIKQQLVNEAFREAVERHSLRPVMTPRIDLTKLELDSARELVFELDFEVVPKFTLGEYKGIEVKAPLVTVTDELVERELDGLRARLATPVTITDGAAEAGDYLKAKLEIRVDGAVVKMVEEAVVDTRTDTIDGLVVDGGTKQFVGKKLGATVPVPVKWPLGYEPAGFAGAEALLGCEIKEISRFTPPPLDDELAKKLGAPDVLQLRTLVRQQIDQTVAQRRNQLIEERVFDDIIGRTTIDVPTDALDRMADSGMHRLAHDMQRNGMEEHEAHEKAHQYLPKIREQSERQLRVSFLADQIATAEKITVGESDLESAVRMLAHQQRRDPQQVADEIIANDAVGQLRSQVLEAKVRKFLRESAKVTDVEPAAEPAGTPAP